MTGRCVQVNEADLKEFIEAAEEVKDEAAHSVSDVQIGAPLNALYPSTEDRFERALDTLKFALAEAANG